MSLFGLSATLNDVRVEFVIRSTTDITSRSLKSEFDPHRTSRTTILFKVRHAGSSRPPTASFYPVGTAKVVEALTPHWDVEINTLCAADDCGLEMKDQHRLNSFIQKLNF